MSPSVGEGQNLGVRLDSGPSAAAAARRAVVAADGSLPDSVRNDVLLLVTELVTNAVRHGNGASGGTVDLGMRMSAGRIRVDVAHPGSGFSHEIAVPSRGEDGGWGLYLVDRVADDWGIEGTNGSTSVWFVIRFAV